MRLPEMGVRERERGEKQEMRVTACDEREKLLAIGRNIGRNKETG